MASLDAIPTRLLMQPARHSVSFTQRRLDEAQIEATSGRHHDLGLAIGEGVGAALGLRLQLAEVHSREIGAGQAALRTEGLQSSLSAVSDVLNRFRSNLASARGTESGRTTTSELARLSLESLQSTLSVTVDGQYLFGGLASTSPPLTSYEDGPRQAVIDSFTSFFGFPPNDPSASTLTKTQLQDFIDGPFSSLFESSAWESLWSSATSDSLIFRTSAGSKVPVSSSASASFAKETLKALSLIELTGNSKINASSFGAVVDRSLELSSNALLKVTDEQARIGLGQASLKDAQISLAQRKSALNSAISSLESVDPYEAATRVNSLMNQLEAAYALTARISKMTLLSYI